MIFSNLLNPKVLWWVTTKAVLAILNSFIFAILSPVVFLKDNFIQKLKENLNLFQVVLANPDTFHIDLLSW